MAEETVKVPEAVVIPYGQESIDYNKFLTNAADSVLSYVDKLPWSKKRKEYFWQAYNDLMNKGITGASNDTGVWTVNHKGDAVPLESLPKKLLEMYGEAAYFIQQLMSKIPVLAKEDEEKKKADLLLFDNDYFTNSFNKHIGNKLFGGQKWDTQKHWNVLDERGENGLRGRRNRANKLAKMLQSYSDSLKENSYNFEGTAFNDLSDLKNRINIAINALKTESPDDDRDALNQLGLDADVYFNDGSGDLTVDANGNPITYGELYKQNQELAKKRAAEEQQKLAALRRANAGVLNFIGGIHGTDAATNPLAYSEYISQRLGTGLLGYNAMNAAVQNLINAAATNTLESAGRRQLGNFLYYIRTNNPNYQKSNITDLEWAELNTHKNLKSANRAGFVRLPWQTSEGRYTYADDKGNLYFLKPANLLKFNAPAILRSAAYNNYKNNFLKGPNLIPRGNGVELTTADYVDLGALAADVISLVDPEPISAGVLGAGAGIARATNADWSNHFWRSLGSSALDIGTGAIGALPVLGDSAIAAKILKNLAKYGKYISYYIAANNLGPAKQAWDKIDFSDPSSFKKLTPDDYRALYNVLQGMVAGRHAVTLNLAGRRALLKRGYEVSNRWDKKIGLTSSKLPTTGSTVKVNLKGKETEIPISATSKEKLEKDLRKAGNNKEAQDNAIRKVEEVQIAATKLKLNLDEDVKAVYSNSLRNARMFGLRMGILPKSLRTTKEHFGLLKVEATPTNSDTFEKYLNERGVWDKMLYGSNRTLRALDPGKGVPKVAATEGQKTTESNKEVPEHIVSRFNNPTRRDAAFFKNTLERAKNPKGASKPLKDGASGNIVIDGKNIKFNYLKDAKGLYSLVIDANGKITTTKLNPDKGSFDAKRLVAETIEKARLEARSAHRLNKTRNELKMNDLIKQLKTLKKLGFLKQGGQINKSTELIITDFINNLK